jgi:hypothetical protein
LPQRHLPSFDSFTHLHDLLPFPRNQDASLARCTRDVAVGTDCFGRKAAACQTASEEEGRGDLRISISLCGEGRPQQQEQIVKIISELHIEREIEAKLRGEKSEESEGKTAASKMSGLNRTLLSTYEYYRNRLVASRIKKYRFSKPAAVPAKAQTRDHPSN